MECGSLLPLSDVGAHRNPHSGGKPPQSIGAPAATWGSV